MVKYKRGDIIELDFNPTKGREQKGKRPALVVSNNAYYRKTGLLIVCPISNTTNAFPMHIDLPDGLKTTGVVLTQHIRTIDPKAREIRILEKMQNDSLDQVLNIIELFFKK